MGEVCKFHSRNDDTQARDVMINMLKDITLKVKRGQIKAIGVVYDQNDAVGYTWRTYKTGSFGLLIGCDHLKQAISSELTKTGV